MRVNALPQNHIRPSHLIRTVTHPTDVQTPTHPLILSPLCPFPTHYCGLPFRSPIRDYESKLTPLALLHAWLTSPLWQQGERMGPPKDFSHIDTSTSRSHPAFISIGQSILPTSTAFQVFFPPRVKLEARRGRVIKSLFRFPHFHDVEVVAELDFNG